MSEARRNTTELAAPRRVSAVVPLLLSLLLTTGVVLVSCWLFILKPKPPVAPVLALAAHAAPPATGTATPQVAPSEMSISGTVRSRTGQALQNARVCAATVSSEVFWAPRETCVVPDRSGAYRIAPLESKAYVVTAAADHFQPTSASLGNGIFLEQGEEKTGIDIVLETEGAKLSGQVLDATGGPISGATIRVLRQALPHDTVVTSSGVDGRFSAWLAPARVTVLVEAPEYAAARVAHVAPSSDLVVRLTPGSSISGRVVAALTGAAVAGVAVRAVPVRAWNSPTRPAGTSNAEGAFEIRGLEPNTYTLIGEGPGWRGESQIALPIGLAEQTAGVTLKVSAAAGVTGKVVQQGTGAPCSRGTVTLGPLQAPPTPPGPGGGAAPSLVPTIAEALQGDGTVRFQAVPAGKYHVDLQCTDFILSDGPTTLDVGPTDLNGVVWQVHPGVRISVQAVDELDQPAANAHLWLSNDPTNAAGAQPDRHIPFLTDNEGKHEFTGLAPGLYFVEPGTGYKGQRVPVDARSSEKVTATVHLQGRGSILVTVQTPDRVGVDQVEVSALAWNNDPAPAANLDAKTKPVAAERTLSRRLSSSGTPGTPLGNGRFQIGPLAAGSYRVQVNDGINPPAEPTDWPQGVVRVRAGASQASVILRRAGSIRGRVVDSAGQGLPDLWVSASCSSDGTENGPNHFRSRLPSRSGSSSRMVSDAEGRFRIDGLESDASCAVRAEQPGGTVAVASRVHPGNEVVVTMPALGALHGTARLSDGSPVPRFTLSIYDPETGASRSEAVSAGDGRWSLTRVAPGHLQLSAVDPTGSTAQAHFELGPGEQGANIDLQFQSVPLSGLASGSYYPKP